MSRKPDQIQRTLILTCGPLAQTAGAAFEKRLQAAGAPAAAIAVVACSQEGPEDSLEIALTEALRRISPPDLAITLAEAGWQLAAAAIIDLILVVDVAADGQQHAAALLEQAANTIYQFLGIEPTSLLIWLAGENQEAAAAACLQESLPLSRGVIALSQRNEAGLRLANADGLSHICSELLWLLALTPLYELPDWAEAHNGYAHHPLLLTVGLHGWCWDPVATHAAFVTRWLESVLAHWLASIPDAEKTRPETVSAWLGKHQLTPAQFLDAATDCLTPAALSEPESWQAPRPWQLRTMWQTLLNDNRLDQERQEEHHNAAGFCLTEMLWQGQQTVQAFVENFLNDRPVAGVARMVDWLQAMIDLCDEWHINLLDQEKLQQETDALLAQERGVLEPRVTAWLADWPKSAWPAWLHVAWRPWRWPLLVWRYWQLRQAGRRTAFILQQQALRRRQKVAYAAVRQALADWERYLRHLQSNVEEIGDMLQYLTGEIGERREIPPSSDAGEQAATAPLTELPLPHALYSQLIPDEEKAAVAAAAAIGGLGQQVKRLDDTIIQPLRYFGNRQLAQVHQFTAIDALAAVVDDEQQRQLQWQGVWEAARPLWRFNAARLHAAERDNDRHLTIICGAGAASLPDLLPVEESKVRKLETHEHDRLILVRVRFASAIEALITGSDAV